MVALPLRNKVDMLEYTGYPKWLITPIIHFPGYDDDGCRLLPNRI